MLWLATRELLARRLSTALSAFGLLAATLGFIVLAATSQTTAAVLRGDIASTWDTPYDLLVRPASSVSALERDQGMVRPNYVTALGAGGITRDQLAAIRAVPSVQVAAPIAIVGFVFWPLEGFAIQLPRPARGSAIQVYRMTFVEVADADSSRFPIEVHYLIVAPDGHLRIDDRTLVGQLTTGGRTVSCAYPVSCWAPDVCFGSRCGPNQDPPSYGLEMLQPVLVAGIDPEAEAALVGLNHCLVSGRYLSRADAPRPATDQDPPGTRLPALVSNRSFVDASLIGQLERGADSTAVLRGEDPSKLVGWRAAGGVTTSVDDLYRTYLPRIGSEVGEWPPWSVSDVGYDRSGAGSLIARSVRTDIQAFQRQNFRLFGAGEALVLPPELQDGWFRQVVQHGYQTTAGNQYWARVGTYDPSCLPGFTQLAGGAGLETYAVPKVRLADDRELRPNRSLAGYLNTPPVVLTILDGAAWLTEPTRFHGGAGASFISAIRVRVSNLGPAGERAERIIARVAADIHDATGLAVDVVKGSSTRSVSIGLPAGRFGRPPMQAQEAWSVKGVAIRFARAVTSQNLALFALALVAGTVLIATTAYIAARRRQLEFGVLRALGWPTHRITQLVVIEMMLLGLGVGLTTVVVGLSLSFVVSTGALALAAIASMPLAVGLAVVASLPAALATAKGTALSGMARHSAIRMSHPARFPITLGLVDMLRTWRVEAVLSAGVIGLGGALLGVLVLVAVAFRGELDTTVLGIDLAGRVRSFHFALAALTVVIGSVGAGQVISISYLERRPHLAALRALGWSRRHLAAMIAGQAIVIGIGGATVAIVSTSAAALATSAKPSATVIAIGAGLTAAVASTMIAAALPIFQVYAGSPVRSLHEA